MSWKCPECESDSLSVVVMTSATLVQESDGNFQTEVDGDHEWDGNSSMTCTDCGHSGAASEFEE